MGNFLALGCSNCKCVRVTVWRIFPGPNVDWGVSRMQNFLFRKTVQFSFLFNPRGLSRSACEEGVDRARTFGRAHFPGFAAGIEIKFSGLGKKNRARFSRLWKGKKRRANRNFLSSVLSLNHCLVFGGKVQNITRSTFCGY